MIPYRGKMEQILPACCLPKETVRAVIMLDRNMKIKVRSPNGDTDLNIVTGVLQGSYLFIICQNYLLQTLLHMIKENGFTLKKDKK